MATENIPAGPVLLSDSQFAELKAAILSRTPKEVMTREEAAEYLSLSLQNLDLLRTNGGGPKYVQLGRLIRYRKAELDRWCDENTHAHSAAAIVARMGVK